MKKVTVADIDPQAPPDDAIPDGAMANSVGGASVLTDSLGTTGLSINHYTLAPDESFTVSPHRHSTQEELFYVLSGTVRFETDAGDTTVESGKVVRIPPGTFQLGTNESDQQATALALGAPRDYEDDTEWLVECDDCGEQTVHIFGDADEPGEYVYTCTECDGETFRVV
ncbi:cupin domain-containing protein [Haloarchaeobius sp. DFWS5]|uniref:cupin domain-containing protein n=1 Tax=Haloarchaeobius sp. DFWS5 TaxID=3446114 RepID=UPI003EBDEFF7